MSDEKPQTTFIQKALLVFFPIALILAMAGAGELYCRWLTRINFLGISRGMFVANAFGDSYGNTPNFRGVAFGAEVKTDGNGFRVDPTYRGSAIGDAVLILGDSVAFGVGVDASKTVAGLLQRALPNERIYNSAVIGYGLHDYANVVSHFVPNRPEIKHAILFYCLNDIYDTSAEQIVEEVNGITAKPGAFTSLHAFATTTNEYLRSRSKLYLFLKTALTDPAMRYFEQDLSEYEKRAGSIAEALHPLRDIADKLSAAGVTFEVFVMPYAGQLRMSQTNSMLPQRLVDGFLHNNGIAYFDAAEAFVTAKAASSDLFLYGDPMHLSEKGHHLSFRFIQRELTKQLAN